MPEKKMFDAVEVAIIFLKSDEVKLDKVEKQRKSLLAEKEGTLLLSGQPEAQ